MRVIPLERDWVTGGIGIGGFWAMMLFIMWAVTWSAVGLTLGGRPLIVDATWPEALVTDLICVLTGCYVASIPLKSLRTVFTDVAILQPYPLLGIRIVRWEDIISVEGVPMSLVIRTRQSKVTLNLYLFKDRQRVLDEIRRRLPAGVPVASRGP